MSSDQWGVGAEGAEQLVRVYFTFRDGTSKHSEVLPRWRAERDLANALFLAEPFYDGKPVASAIIKPWTHN